ncbi:hypothetical protein RI054_16g76410 [Pseudoscourfieldia marina]
MRLLLYILGTLFMALCSSVAWILSGSSGNHDDVDKIFPRIVQKSDSLTIPSISSTKESGTIIVIDADVWGPSQVELLSDLRLPTLSLVSSLRKYDELKTARGQKIGVDVVYTRLSTKIGLSSDTCISVDKPSVEKRSERYRRINMGTAQKKLIKRFNFFKGIEMHVRKTGITHKQCRARVSLRLEDVLSLRDPSALIGYIRSFEGKICLNYTLAVFVLEESGKKYNSMSDPVEKLRRTFLASLVSCRKNSKLFELFSGALGKPGLQEKAIMRQYHKRLLERNFPHSGVFCVVSPSANAHDCRDSDGVDHTGCMSWPSNLGFLLSTVEIHSTSEIACLANLRGKVSQEDPISLGIKIHNARGTCRLFAPLHGKISKYLFIDVGGHGGEETLLGLQENFEVINFEMRYSSYMDLIEKFKFVKDVHFANAGVGNETSLLAVHEAGSSSSLVEEALRDTSTQRKARLLQRRGKNRPHNQIVVALDNLFHDNMKRIAFIKLDVQGFEREILAGASCILRDAKPVIVMEYMKGLRPKPPIYENVAFLHTLGYRCFDSQIHVKVSLLEHYSQLKMTDLICAPLR